MPKIKLKPIMKKLEQAPKQKLMPQLKPKLKPKPGSECTSDQSGSPTLKKTPTHHAIVTPCICGSFILKDGLIGIQFSDNEQGRREHALWQFVKQEIGVRAKRYFSLPIDAHECPNNYILTFNNDGHDLSSDLILEKIAGAQYFDRLRDIFYRVAQGLELLNSIGVIHLDVKPENIVVDPVTLSPKIIDIGNGLKINSELRLIPSINLDDKTIYDPSYVYYPPHKFYFEQWITDVTNLHLSTVCNLVSDYCSAHRVLIRDVLLDDAKRLELINIYQRDDPRAKILKISKNAEKLYDYQRLELNKWDVYGLGISILEMIKIGADINNLWYDRLLHIGLRMTSPDAQKRISFNDAMDILS